MLPRTANLPNPYGCSRFSNANKIFDWVVILIMLLIIVIYGPIAPHQQCIPGDGSDCSDYAHDPDPAFAYPLQKSTVDFAVMNIVCPLIWLTLFLINSFIIHWHQPLFQSDKLWQMILIKAEILFRCIGVSLSFTALTTEIMKNSVGRPRPNYLSNDDANDRWRSFPSGHTSYIFSIFLLLTLFLLQSLLNARKIMYFQLKDAHIQSMNRNLQKRVTIDNIDSAEYNDIRAEKSAESASDDEADDNRNKRILLMDGEIFNALKVDKIMNVFNGDSYFFLSLFIFFKHCQLLSVLIALSPTIFAIYVGCSRLTDYKHHYSDVLCGGLIGSCYAVLSFMYYKAEFYYGFRYDMKKIFDSNRDQKGSNHA